MSRPLRSTAMAVLLAVILAVGPSMAAASSTSRRLGEAENAGQEDLNRATDLLTARPVGDLSEAIGLLESALEKGLDQEQARFAKSLLASTLIRRGTDAAKRLFLTPPQDPKFPDRRKAALADLEKGVQLSPQQPEALYLVARLNVLPGGDAKRAADALGKAIELWTEEPARRAKALMLRAGLEKDPQKKMADLDEAVRIAPRNADVIRTRGLLRADMGKLEEGLADLNKAIELAPNHAPTYQVKAIVLARMKRYDEALVSLDKASELSPGSLAPLIQKVRIHTLQKNLDAALYELSRAHEMAPKSPDVLILRAGVYQDLGQKEKALADVDQALKLKPNLPGAMRLRAMLLAEAERLGEAIAQLEQLRKLDPKDLPTLLQLGMLYAVKKQYEQAVEAYSALLAQRPDEWTALRARADSLLSLGRHKQAIADYEKAVKLQPKDPALLNNLAWVLATSPVDDLRDGKRALALATEACELTEYKRAYILSTLGAAYAETGDFPSAIKWAQKGAELASKDEKEAIGKELEGYRAGKPFRERFSPDQPQEPQDKPKDDEPQPEKRSDEKPEEKPDKPVEGPGEQAHRQ